jgi:hypothetical protein
MDYHECQWSFHFKNFVLGTSDSQMSCSIGISAMLLVCFVSTGILAMSLCFAAIGISVMSLCFVSIEILTMPLCALLHFNLNFGDATLLSSRCGSGLSVRAFADLRPVV